MTLHDASSIAVAEGAAVLDWKAARVHHMPGAHNGQDPRQQESAPTKARPEYRQLLRMKVPK